jgi:hypothetical protein
MTDASPQRDTHTTAARAGNRGQSARKANRVTTNFDDDEIQMLQMMMRIDGETMSAEIRRSVRERWARILQLLPKEVSNGSR